MLSLDKLVEEGNKIFIIESIVSTSRERDIKIESEALVSTSDFRPVLTKSTVSWEWSISSTYLVRTNWYTP